MRFKAYALVCLSLSLLVSMSSGCMTTGVINDVLLAGQYSGGYIHFINVNANSVICSLSIGWSDIGMTRINSSSVAFYTRAAGTQIGILNAQNFAQISYLSIGASVNTYDLAYHSGQNLLISANSDLKARVWNLTTMSIVNSYSGHAYAVRSSLGLSDGRVITGDDGGSVHIWDLVYFGCAMNFGVGFAVYSIVQVSTDLVALAGTVTNIYIYNITTGGSIRSFSNVGGTTVYWMQPFGSNMLVAPDCSGYIRIYDWTTGTYLAGSSIYGGYCMYRPGTIVNNKMPVVSYASTSFYTYNVLGTTGFSQYSSHGVGPNGFTGAQFIDTMLTVQIQCTTAAYCDKTSSPTKVLAGYNIELSLNCSGDCTSTYVSKYYSWTVYQNLGTLLIPSWSSISTSQASYVGATTSATLLLYSSLFSAFSTPSYKVDMVFTVVRGTGNKTFSDSLVLAKSVSGPGGGACSVSPTTGVAIATLFTISCSGWTVNSGSVSSYTFYAKTLDNANVTLGSSTTGNLSASLNAGLSSDGYKWYLYVQITSNQGISTIYNLASPIVVNATSSAEVLSSVTDLLANGSLLVNASVAEASTTLNTFAQAINQAGNSTNLTATAASSIMNANAQLVSAVSSLGPVTAVSDISSVSSILSTVSSNPVLLSADTAVSIGSLCVDLVNNLASAVSGQDASTLTSAASNILEAVANSQKSVNNQNTGQSGVQSNQLTSAISSTAQVVNGVTNIASQMLPDGNTTEIVSTNIKLAVTKSSASSIKASQSTGGCTIEIDDPCGMLGLSASACASSSIVSQSFSMPYAFVGANGNSGLNIGSSKSVGLKFFSSSMTENQVSNYEPGIQFWIAKSSSDPLPFQQVDYTNLTQKASSQNQLLCFSISMSTPNQSISIDIMPLNSSNSVGYLIVLNYGKIPVVSSASQEYDSFLISCPDDLKQESGDSFHRLFSNMSANADLDSVAGYGFRQLTSTEYTEYCVRNQTATGPPLLPDSFTDYTSLFTIPISQRVYAAGCYYLDESTAEWSSYGTEVLSDSNTTHTHCVAKHLTQFAGGTAVLPPSIDFNNVWANASFTKNMTIYLTVIIVSSLYLVLLVLCRYKDWKDETRRSVFIMADNDPMNQYFYELIVFTGSRKDAGTHSKVSLILAGNESETDVRMLSPSREHHKNVSSHVLLRGSVQSFLMSVEHSLGTELRYMRIWHDNSGRARHASWFLKFIIVHDLQTRDKFYFICNDWLALDQSDGQLNRLLPVATRKQKTELKYLMEKQTKQNMSDGHLWFSVLARPLTSPFTRTDRVTCAFVLLCITMLVNIMYYGQASENADSSSQLVVGPFNLSSTQIVIGVISNLMIFPPSFLLMQIFRKSRRRVTKTTVIKNNLKKCLDEENLEPKRGMPIRQTKKKVKKPFTLPWWFKIIGYILAACFVGVSIFFIIVKGISFGDDMCRKWLTSFLVSIVTSIVFTQPMQVILLSIFFVLLFKKSNDDADQEQDHVDDGRPLNYAFAGKAKGNVREENDDDAVLVTNSLRDKDFWNDEHLKEVKRKREQERRAWRIIKKLLVYSLFLGLLFNVAYSKTSSRSYLYQTQLQNLMLQNISRVQTALNVWDWMSYQFFPSVLMGKQWYNSESTGSDNLVGDYSSILVGKVQLRMARVKSSPCSRKIGSGTCYFDYSVSSYDNTDYDLTWATLTSSSTSTDYSSAFKYTSALSINSQPYAGQYTNYLGGGYVYSVDAINSDLAQVQQDLANLQANDWIDLSTRALFIEYTLYNVNEDLFCYCTILFEFLPSGSIVTSFVFDPISLFADESVVYVAIQIAYMFIIVFLMLSEIKLAIKMKKAYLRHWWSYVNWTLIALTWTAFFMYLNRLYQKYHLLKKLKSDDDEVINFQLLNYWNQLLMIMLGFCCFLASIKVLQLVSFSRSVTFLMRVFRQCFVELAGFVVFYIILFMAFTQMMYLIVYDANPQFKSFATSLVTGFLMLIGKFNVDSFCQDAGEILGPIVFCIFAVTMIMILLNMFITVLTDSFSQIRNEYRADNKEEDSLMLVFVKERVWPSIVSFVDVRSKLGKSKYRASEQESQYKDNMAAFEVRVSDLTTIGKNMARNE